MAAVGRWWAALAAVVGVVMSISPTAASAPAEPAGPPVALSVALDGGRSLALNLRPTSDGRAQGTLAYADPGARLRFRAERVDSLATVDGTITVIGASGALRGGGGRFRVVVRAPRPDAVGHLSVDLSAPGFPAYRAAGDLRAGVVHLGERDRRATAVPTARTAATATPRPGASTSGAAPLTRSAGAQASSAGAPAPAAAPTRAAAPARASADTGESASVSTRAGESASASTRAGESASASTRAGELARALSVESPNATATPTRTVIPIQPPVPLTLYLFGNLGVQSRDGELVDAPASVADSTGQAHELTFRFVRVSQANAWDWQALAFDPSIATANPLASGTITFDPSGLPQTDPTRPESALSLTFNSGAAPLPIDVEMDAPTGRDGYSSLTIGRTRPPAPSPAPAATPQSLALTGNLEAGSPTGAAAETPLQIRDSLGMRHNLTVRFRRTTVASQWNWEVSTLDEFIDTPNPLAGGTLTCDGAGDLQTSLTGPEGTLNLYFNNGAADATGPSRIELEMDAMTCLLQPSDPAGPAIVQPTATPTQTSSPTVTRTATRSPTVTATPTITRSPTVTATPTTSPTPTSTSTPTRTATSLPTRTPTATPTPTIDRSTLAPVGNLDSRAAAEESASSTTWVLDGQGSPHDLTIVFERRPDANAWSWRVHTLELTVVGTDGPLASGQLTFRDDGSPVVDPTGSEGRLTLSFRTDRPDLVVPVQLDRLTGLAEQTWLDGGPFPDPTATPTATPTVTGTVVGGWTGAGTLLDRRSSHAAVALADGRVLAVGGGAPSGTLPSAELWSAAHGHWLPTGGLRQARYDLSATLLDDGRVLVAGGSSDEGPLATAELYDPRRGLWLPTGRMAVPRARHTATRLLDGRVLVVGGADDSSAELYDPALGSWSGAGRLVAARDHHTATRLRDGRVLVAAGLGTSDALASAELYDPVGGRWSSTGPLSIRRSSHTASLLPDGRVLVVGGRPAGPKDFDPVGAAELYDPESGRWAPAAGPDVARMSHSAVALADGRVLVVGGLGREALPLFAAELYDPTGRTWRRVADQRDRRVFADAVPLPDGRALAVGGDEGEASTAELFSAGPVAGPALTPTAAATGTPAPLPPWLPAPSSPTAPTPPASSPWPPLPSSSSPTPRVAPPGPASPGYPPPGFSPPSPTATTAPAGPAPIAGPSPAATVVGASGGSIASDPITVRFDPGTVADGTTIDLAPRSLPDRRDGFVPIASFEIGANGGSLTVLEREVTIEVSYDPAALGGLDPSGLAVFIWVDGAPLRLPGQVDLERHVVIGRTRHFTEFGLGVLGPDLPLFAPTLPPPPQPSGGDSQAPTPAPTLGPPAPADLPPAPLFGPPAPIGLPPASTGGLPAPTWPGAAPALPGDRAWPAAGADGPDAAAGPDYDLPNGHVFTQTAEGRGGYAVLDQDGVRLWSEFQRLGGVGVLGYPISQRFEWDGFQVQVFQRAVVQWRPEIDGVYFVNVFDRLHELGLDGWLSSVRQTPPPRAFADEGLEWDAVVASHLGVLEGSAAIRAAYWAAPTDPLLMYGLPVSDVVDMGNHRALRTQRAVFQEWKEDVPWARAGEVTVALGGSIAQETGALPALGAFQPG